MATKLFDMNDFAISGIPKIYKTTAYGISIGILTSGAPGGKYLWCNLSNRKGVAPFTEQEFLAAGHISLVSFKMDSWVSQGSTRYSTKANGQAAVLGVDLEINIGKVGGKVSNVNPAMHMAIVSVPYMGRDGNTKDAKPLTKYREVMVKWPEHQDMPAVETEIFVMGSLRISQQGGLYIEARKALVL